MLSLCLSLTNLLPCERWLLFRICVTEDFVLLQACRGDGLDGGVEVDSAADTSRECCVSQYLSVPVDTAVMYATAPGKLQHSFLCWPSQCVRMSFFIRLTDWCTKYPPPSNRPSPKLKTRFTEITVSCVLQLHSQLLDWPPDTFSQWWRAQVELKLSIFSEQRTQLYMYCHWDFWWIKSHWFFPCDTFFLKEQNVPTVNKSTINL